jgi:uncharacterized protein (UPF0332 family)
MSWQRLLDSHSVRPHATTLSEIEGLRSVVNRDLKDAALLALSADRRFATAYNAVLQLAKMAIACEGYRVSTGTGHHQITFEAVKTALGSRSSSLSNYFEICRRKRNNLDYDVANVVTETEATEMFTKAIEFRNLVEAAIAKSHPQFKATP